jgi:putative ABC transport system permease protein
LKKHSVIYNQQTRNNDMTTIYNDIKYAMRQFWTNPGFSLVAVLTLALGAGANIVMFSVANAVLLRPLPYPKSERLYQLTRQQPIGVPPITTGTKFLFWRDNNRSFESMAAYDINGSGLTLTDAGEAQRIQSIRVSCDFFRTLDMPPAWGRDFTEQDALAGSEPVCIISYGLWHRCFGADQSMIGKIIRLSGKAFTIVGVAPRGFTFSPEADIWTPLQLAASANDSSNLYLVLGRLKPGVSAEQANTDLTAVADRLRVTYPNLMNDNESIGLRSFHEYMVGTIRPTMMILMGAVALVLLVTCGNLANLLLARGSARRREVALRAALGAKGSRIIRQLLTENILLAFAGVLLGLALTPLCLILVRSLSPVSLNPLNRITIDHNVLLFSMGISLVTALLFGLFPAIQAARTNLQSVLRDGTSRGAAGADTGRLRSLLVVGQMALSVVLVISATLLMTSFLRLAHVDPGFEPTGVLTMEVSMPNQKYQTTQQTAQFLDQVNHRLQALPGVESAAVALTLPFRPAPDAPFEIQGRQGPSEEKGGQAAFRPITSDYFKVMQVPFLEGRNFQGTENAQSTPVVIINEALRSRYFPDSSPLGQFITIVGMGNEPPKQVIGVVENIREGGLDAEPAPAIFIPYAQMPGPLTAMLNQVLPKIWVVRTQVIPMSLQTAIRREVGLVDPEVAVSSFRTLEQVVGSSIKQERFNMVLAGTFAGLAMLLAAIGLYGVLSFSVARRTREMGVRMALGATRREILWLVIKQGMFLALTGLAAGIVATFGLIHLLRSMLFGITPNDPATFLVVSVLLTFVAALACVIPARRAAKTDPMEALRYE